MIDAERLKVGVALVGVALECCSGCEESTGVCGGVRSGEWNGDDDGVGMVMDVKLETGVELT